MVVVLVVEVVTLLVVIGIVVVEVEVVSEVEIVVNVVEGEFVVLMNIVEGDVEPLLLIDELPIVEGTIDTLLLIEPVARAVVAVSEPRLTSECRCKLIRWLIQHIQRRIRSRTFENTLCETQWDRMACSDCVATKSLRARSVFAVDVLEVVV